MLTVIIPCYNQGEYFQECIDSLKNQTYKDIEVIAVDDKAIDDSIAIADKNGLKIVRMKKNSGIPKAVNKGLKEAKGKYLVVMSQDDKFDPSYFERAIKILEENPNIGVVTSDMLYFGSENCITKIPAKWTFEDLRQNNSIHGSSVVRKECYKDGFDEKTGRYSDWEMWIRICKQGWGLYYIQEPLYHFRRHENQQSNVENEELRNYVKAKHA